MFRYLAITFDGHMPSYSEQVIVYVVLEDGQSVAQSVLWRFLKRDHTQGQSSHLHVGWNKSSTRALVHFT